MEDPMRVRTFVLFLAAAGLAGAGCAANGEPWGGEPLPEQLVVHFPDEGVYPSRSVLEDPDNPFALGALEQQTIWDLQSGASPVASFYAWATANARGPAGERQFYAALDLKAIYQLSKASDADLPAVRDLSIRGYQAVLDHFPTSVTYDATGTIAYDLATPSVEAILELGGTVQGGWVIVMTADGGRKAVRR
jgi:hypothetical protein